MITLSARPRLASKVRLRHDGKTGQTMLLYPEKGLALNQTGSEIARLCTGQHSVEEMVALLRSAFAPSAPANMEAEVMSFLEALAQRGLIEVVP